MTAPSAAELIRVAKAEVGVHEGRSKNGSWNNIQKYSEELPGFAWSDGQPWCDTFDGWCFWTAGLTEAQAPRSASCDASAAAWKKMGRWSEYPAIGAQVHFGVPGDMQHVGIVTKFDDTYIWTVEGNTNASGSYQGDGVYAKMHERRDARVIGYGYPDFPEGILSADPAWQKPTSGESAQLADISHWNAGPFDFSAALAAGLRGVYLKATQGTGWVDPTYAARVAVIRALARFGLLRRKLRAGAYHFAEPKVGDAVTQARHFLAVAQIQRGDLVPWLDLERDGGLNRRQLTSWVRAWVATVEAAIGRKPAIYTKFDLDDDCGCLLVTARYSDANKAPYVAKPWTAWDLWQFTDGQYGLPDTFPGLGHVDLSTLRPGLRARQLVIRRRHKPKPSPPPPPPPAPSVEFVLGQTSGRFDRSPASLEVLLDELMAKCKVIVGTEVAAEARGKKLNEKGWDHFRGPNKPGADESFAAWAADEWDVLHSESIQVTDKTYFTVDGHETAPVHVAAVVLRHKETGFILLATVGHYPSDVEGHDGPEGIWNMVVERRVAATKDSVAGTAVAVARLAATYKPHGVAILGDFNMNILRAEVRAWFAKQFPGMTPTFPTSYKGKGDLGQRAISFGLLQGLEVTDGPTVHDTAASDHRYELELLASS